MESFYVDKANSRRVNEEYWNVVLASDGSVGEIVKFKVNRYVMRLASHFFRALFSARWSGTGDNLEEISIPRVSGSSLRSLIELCYSRGEQLTDDNCRDIATLADFFMMDDVVASCSRYFISRLNPLNCVGLVKFASDYYFPELRSQASLYLLYNFNSVSRFSEELANLPLEEIARVLESDDLNVKEERTVWEAILRWINRNYAERSSNVFDLLKTVRLGLITRPNELEYIRRDPLVSADPHCVNYLKQLGSRSFLAKPRNPQDILLTFGGWSGGSPTSCVESYDSRNNQWTRLNNLEDPTGPRAYHRCVIVESDVYLVGGFDGTEYFSSCRCFNTLSKTWKEIASMNSRRCYVSAVFFDGFLYAMGGFDGLNRQNTVEKYDPEQNQWFYVEPMNRQRSDACAVVYNNRIYITGGFNGVDCLNSVEFYDPRTDSWTLIREMNSPRSGVSCVVYRGRLYVIGGFDGERRLRSGEIYDDASDTWTLITEMNNPRSNFAIEVMEDSIFVIGGFDGGTTVNRVEKYDATFRAWSDVQSMRVNRSALDVALVSRIPNLKEYLRTNLDNPEITDDENSNDSDMEIETD